MAVLTHWYLARDHSWRVPLISDLMNALTGAFRTNPMRLVVEVGELRLLLSTLEYDVKPGPEHAA
jgi:hypothetical protein